MSNPTHVTVTAPPGRLTPIHPNDGVDLAGHPLRVRPGEIRRVRWSENTRRAVARGDLILCDRAGKEVGLPKDAACPDDLPDLKIVIDASPDTAARRPTPTMQARDPEGRS